MSIAQDPTVVPNAPLGRARHLRPSPPAPREDESGASLVAGRKRKKKLKPSSEPRRGAASRSSISNAELRKLTNQVIKQYSREKHDLLTENAELVPLRKALGLGTFESGIGSLGLAILCESLSTLRALTLASESDGLGGDDDASLDISSAMSAVILRLQTSFDLLHKELRALTPLRSEVGDDPVESEALDEVLRDGSPRLRAAIAATRRLFSEDGDAAEWRKRLDEVHRAVVHARFKTERRWAREREESEKS